MLRRLALLGAPVLAAAAVLVLGTVSSGAATHQVTNGADSGAGSYRQAVLDAAGDADLVTISFDPGLTVTLSSDVAYTGTQPITLQGNGSTIDGNGHQILRSVPNVTVDDLTLTGADSPIGGAINTVGSMMVTDSTFSANHAAIGGGFYANGSATVSRSLFTGNTGTIGAGFNAGGGASVETTQFFDNEAAIGGGLSSIGDLTITNSAFDGNSANVGGGVSANQTVSVTDANFTGNSADAGGAIANAATIAVSTPSPAEAVEAGAVEVGPNGVEVGPEVIGVPVLDLDGTTIAGNQATVGGGVAEAQVITVNGSIVTTTAGGSVAAVNSTFSENSASERGGSISAAAAPVDLLHVTAADSSAPSGAEVEAGDLTSQASVLAGANSPTCTVRSTTSNGDNYDTDGTCGFGAGDRDVSDGPDPQLLPLGDYGGPSLTRPPQATSPLVDSIPVSACAVDVDQRDLPRPSDGDDDGVDGCDVGAVELQAPPPPPPPPPPVGPGAPGAGPVAASPTFTG